MKEAARPLTRRSGRRPDRPAPAGYTWTCCSRCSEPLAITRDGAELPTDQVIGLWCAPCLRYTFLVGRERDSAVN